MSTEAHTDQKQEVIHEAYVLDEKGNEVPITQDMIDRAAKMLEKCLQPFACYQTN